MSDKMSHKERLWALIKGEKTDRQAASVWRHFYHRETTAQGLAEAMLDFQKKYDWDFLKINPRAAYHVEDWGCRLKWSTDEFSNHKKISCAVETISDWDKINTLPITAPVLSEHLSAIKIIRKNSDPELPLLMTIFNPLGVARYLAGTREKLLEHIDHNEPVVVAALERIGRTFENYAAECRCAGADGIFYATLEWASADTLSYDMYQKLCRSLDIRILRAAGSDALNILHVCSANNYLRQLIDYPVSLINWEASHPANINLDAALDIFKGKVAVAGLDDRGWLWHSRPDEITHQMEKLKKQYFGRNVILGPGCAIDPHIPESNLLAVRKAL